MKLYLALLACFGVISAGHIMESVKIESPNRITSAVLQSEEFIVTQMKDVEVEEENTTSFDSETIKCGVRPHVKSGRIVGGKDATFGAWPWKALVRILDENDTFTREYYGGVLIDTNYVITVAHWSSEPNASLAVVFGEFDISDKKSLTEEKPFAVKKVKQITIHPGFNNRTFDDDLAILELESPIRYDTHIVPICMPPDGKIFKRRLATATGWGSLRYGGKFPSILQEVQVPILENELCQGWIESLGYTKKLMPSTICAGYPRGEKDACTGDSGGPLAVERSDGRWELVGIISSGIKCGFPHLPGFYMNMTHYKPWIKSITELSFDDVE